MDVVQLVKVENSVCKLLVNRETDVEGRYGIGSGLNEVL
jgi:hypothetical protein